MEKEQLRHALIQDVTQAKVQKGFDATTQVAGSKPAAEKAAKATAAAKAKVNNKRDATPPPRAEKAAKATAAARPKASKRDATPPPGKKR